MQLRPMYGQGGVAQTDPDLFPSDPSLRSFTRQHADALIARGAILLHRGRWHRTDTFRPAVLEISATHARNALAGLGSSRQGRR